MAINIYKLETTVLLQFVSSDNAYINFGMIWCKIAKQLHPNCVLIEKHFLRNIFSSKDEETRQGREEWKEKM